MKKKIYYIGRYAIIKDNIMIRKGSLAAKNKMDFIIYILNELEYKTIILSPSFAAKSNKFLIRLSKMKMSENALLLSAPSWGREDSIFRIIKNKMGKLWLFLYLCIHANKETPVIVYHDYEYAIPILWAKKIKKFSIILEIEDIYQKVWELNEKQIENEEALLAEAGDNCLVVSEAMKNILDKEKAIISYGNYEIYKGEILQKGKRDKIHIICTGSIDRARGIGHLGLDVIERLPNNYFLSLSGIISDDCKEEILSRIEKINKNAGYEKCLYKGVLSDKEYEKLLLEADIALNPQREGDFDAFIFPSKIITYLSYNLDVVTTPGKSIVESKISKILHIVNDYNPDSISLKIQEIRFSEREDYRKELCRMSEMFKKELMKILEEQ